MRRRRMMMVTMGMGMMMMMGVRGVTMKQGMMPSCAILPVSRIHSFLQFPTRTPFPSSTTLLFWPPRSESARPSGRIMWVRCQERSSSVHETAGSQTKPRLSKKKLRLDELCMEKFPQYSRTLIQSWILQGKVIVDGRPAAKAGSSVKATSIIEIIAEVPKYVCRAGYKLEGALEQFAHDVTGKVVLDSGLSTGGFSDCLLQNGAARIYGVDVGYGQVAEKIRVDPRVTVIERTNLRYLEGLPEQVDLVTLDLSFISILLVMPKVCSVMKPESSIITLIKPQFEARRSQVGGGGIVRDPAVHKEVLQRVISGVERFGFKCQGWIQSPITGCKLIPPKLPRPKDAHNQPAVGAVVQEATPTRRPGRQVASAAAGCRRVEIKGRAHGATWQGHVAGEGLQVPRLSNNQQSLSPS
ncbi:hypothetical protein KC19_3G267300 [Ceratodon purpureus]|uniref:RNA-binding S4 domain-containing protein n=1 Tax=Ceratodon purpureus TaxID=3225 RepID=A0A8T0IQC0_CERPU|nr:hypothetical protein KC19_3G267300 [Ceratodon purpureus]